MALCEYHWLRTGSSSRCRELFGLRLSKENAQEITRRINEFISSRTPERIFTDLYARANVKWSVNDICGDDPVTKLGSMNGKEHLDLFRFAIRHDSLLVPSCKADIQKASRALGRSIRSLRGFVEALDTYTEKASSMGKLAAIKIGLAYNRPLDFEPASKATAERFFSSMMIGRKRTLNPCMITFSSQH